MRKFFKGRVYVDNIPCPSAKRLEKDRRLVIQAAHAFGIDRQEIPIPENEARIEFDFHDESIDEPEVLDGDIHYRFFVEYRNATGSRMERVEVEPTPV